MVWNSSQLFSWWFILLLAVFVVGLVIVILLLIKKQRSASKKELKVNEKIVRLFVEARKKGFDESLLREKLIKRGFDKKVIGSALDYIEKGGGQGEKSEEIQQPPKKVEKEVKVTVLPFSKEDIKKTEIKPDVVEEKVKKVFKAVPYKKEEIKRGKVRLRVRGEPRAHGFIGSLDNLERVKKKISQRKNVWASKVVGRGELV